MGWLNDYIPNAEAMEEWREQMRRFGKNVSQMPQLPVPKKVRVKKHLSQICISDVRIDIF